MHSMSAPGRLRVLLEERVTSASIGYAFDFQSARDVRNGRRADHRMGYGIVHLVELHYSDIPVRGTNQTIIFNILSMHSFDGLYSRLTPLIVPIKTS